MVVFGPIPFTCSGTLNPVLECCSGVGERRISSHAHCSGGDVQNGAISEHCSSHYQKESKLKSILSFLNLYHTITSFKDPEKYAFENTVGKVENAVK